MLRSASTRWFEVLTPRSESVHTVSALAATGAVEIELREQVPEDFPVQHLRDGLSRYQKYLPRYGRYWERGVLRRLPFAESPEVVLERALARIEAWRREADPLIETLQGCEEEMQRLKWLRRIIGRIADGPLDFAMIAQSGPVVGTFCTVLPEDTDLSLPDGIITRSVPWEDERCYLILGPAGCLDQAKRQAQLAKGRIIERPDWLTGDAMDSVARIESRRHFLSVRAVHLNAELDGLFEEYSLGDVLREVAWLNWFAEQVGGLELASDHLVWVTGWTNDLSGDSLSRALDRAGTRSLLRFGAAPGGKFPPRVLDNPRWLKPFEVFAGALGVPGSDEADPTPLLAVVTPLLFGYMFGDVGQGLMLLLLGLWLRSRFDQAGLLIAGGIAAMLFGLLFGSVFAREDLIPALWLHPMAEPVVVLAVPLGFAVALLSLGQVLSGLGALWRGELHRWLAVAPGFLLLYWGVIGWLAGLSPRWVPLVGHVWYLAGSFLTHRRLAGVFVALGHMVESSVQILVNTLSFARVGAFALAHAALSLAIVTMADAAPAWASLLILILGNVLITLLEGLVVSIQTTRLVLFEFFNRFLIGNGRVFMPLPVPPATVVGG